MKRVQVFKKTLLSVAVMAALGGNASLSYSAEALESMKIKEVVFQEGVKPQFWVDAAGQVVAFGKSDTSRASLTNEIRSLLVDKGKAFDRQIKILKTDIKYSELEQKVKDADEAHKVAATEDDKKKKKELLDTAVKDFDAAKKEVAAKEKKLLSALVEELNKKAGTSLFEFEGVATEDTGSNDNNDNNTPAEPQYRGKPLEKVIAPEAVPAASAELDGKSVKADEALVQAEGESETDFKARVKVVTDEVAKLKDEQIKPLFMVKETVKGQNDQPDTEKWVAAPSVRIGNVDLTNQDVRTALLDKIKIATALEGGSGSVVELSNDVKLTFKSDQLELQNVHNSALVNGKESDSVIADVYSTKKDATTGPAGSYVLNGRGSLYHKAIGQTRALKELKVEGQKVMVQGETRAQHVTIGQGGSISGYSLVDEKGENDQPAGKKVEQAGYARIVAAMPADALIKNDKNEVIGRQNSTVDINSDEAQRGDVVDFEVVNFSGKDWHTTEISGDQVNLSKGNLTFEDNGKGLAAVTLNVAEGVVLKATKEINDPKDQSGKTKVIRDLPVDIKGRDITLQKQVSNDSGKNWADVTDETVIVDRKHVIDGDAIANFEDIDSLTVNGTLATNKVGSDTKRLKEFTLGKSGKVIRFSNEGNTVYTENKVEYVISAGQELVNDVDGFKSFKLDGGLFEGNLTASAAAADAQTNKKAFQGSDIVLTSGTYQGGTIKSDNDIVIDGDVVFKPGVTALKSFDAEGNQQSTSLKPVLLDGNVLLTDSARPVIYKTYKIAGEDGKQQKLATPVQWGKNATMKKGAELSVSLDMSESAEDSAVTYVSVAETLTVDGNIVRANVDYTTDYDITRDLYEKTSADKEDKGKDFAIIDAKEIKGDFGAPVSSSMLLKAKGVTTDKDGRKVYGVNLSFNGDVMDELRQAYSLNSQQTSTVGELEKAALTTTDQKAGKELHEQVQSAIANKTVKQFANENTQNNVVNGGLAQSALTVHRKVNENISRRLDRSRTGISSGDMFESQGFWGQYFYSDGSLDTKGDVLGYESKINGITIGVDADLNPDLTAGLAFSYAKSKLNTKTVSGESKSDTYMGSVYAGWNNGPYFLDGMLSYAGSRNDLERAKYKADSVKGTMWSARAVGGYMHQIQQWSLQPQAEFNYSSFKLDEFSETGGSAGQRVKVNDYNIMELGAGLKVFGEFDAGRGTIKPEASLMAYHDFKDDKPAGSYQLLISPANNWIPLPSGNREQNRYALGLGGTYAMDNNLTLGLNYDYNWSGDFKAHGFMARISYEF